VAGSGYRRPPCLVRRADGQVLQLTPVLYAVLDAVDGHRNAEELAAHLVDHRGLSIEPSDVDHLVEAKLRPLGVLRRADGQEPAVQRSNPLLALRGRVAVLKPETARRITAPLVGLFSPVVVAVVLVAFAFSSGWLLWAKGLASATRQALYEPDLLLVVIGLTLASAAFHELGHAAACLRGGARPGAMGMGLYLVWPAFYTDVSDSYRLDRRSRLRVDLGGLYFNAVFGVAVFALWAITRADALLVVVPFQLFQMLRQLVPFVRFDGYHILADLTGVPDLFARIKPTLMALWPTRWGQGRSELKPWARLVITVWVLVVIPVLSLSLVLMVVALPRIVATTLDSLGRQASYLAVHWDEGQLARIVLGSVSIAAIALPALSVSYLLARVVRRTSRKLWRATSGSLPHRMGLVAAAVAVLVALAAAWWPDGQYRPIQRHERGTLLEGVQAVVDGRVPVRALAAQAPSVAAVEAGPADAAGSDPIRRSRLVAPAGAAAPVERPRHTFRPPAAPGEGDNQALAVNYGDGTAVTDMASSLVWDTDGTVTSRNQAYGLASCTDCSTVAVAFQVVLVVGEADQVVPVNTAVAVNEACVRCATAALSVQTVLSLPNDPTASQRTQLAAIWARVDAVKGEIGSLTPQEVRTRLDAIKADIVGLFGPGVRELVDDHDSDEAEPTTAEADPTTSTTALADDGAAAGPSSTTTTSSGSTTAPPTTGEPQSSTTTTEPPSSTTNAAPGPEPEPTTTSTTVAAP
jgi:putative peptide zinc metalloprotease protein